METSVIPSTYPASAPGFGGWEGLSFLQEEVETIRADRYRGDEYSAIGTRAIWDLLHGATDFKKLFDLCAPLAAAISMRAEAFANGIFEAVNPNTKNYLRGQFKDWDSLSENPNPLQSRSQFLTQLELYRLLRGWCYAMPVYPTGFDGERPESLWLLPYWCIEVEALPLRKPFYLLRKGEKRRRIWFVCDGLRTELDESKLILFTDNGSPVDPVTGLPEGRIRSLGPSIGNWIGSMESRGTLIHTRGATGILSMKGPETSQVSSVIPLDPDEKAYLQRLYQHGDASSKHPGYGLRKGQWGVVLTSASLNWQPMVFDVEQLGLHPETISTAKDIYGRFQVPFELSPHSEQSTYNNTSTAWKGFYQDAIMPAAKGVMEQLNAGLNTIAQGVKYIVSYEDVSYLQDSEETKGKGRQAMNQALRLEWDAGLITRNMWLEAIGRDTVKGKPQFDKYKWELKPEELGQFSQNTDDNGE